MPGNHNLAPPGTMLPSLDLLSHLKDNWCTLRHVLASTLSTVTCVKYSLYGVLGQLQSPTPMQSSGPSMTRESRSGSSSGMALTMLPWLSLLSHLKDNWCTLSHVLTSTLSTVTCVKCSLYGILGQLQSLSRPMQTYCQGITIWLLSWEHAAFTRFIVSSEGQLVHSLPLSVQ